MKEFFSDQAVLAAFPIVALGILVGLASIYFVRKERRESREQGAKRN